MKSFTVTAFFPEVKAHLAYQSATVKATGFSTAAARGFKEMHARPGIARKRITEVRLTVRLTVEAVDSNSGGKS